MTFLTLQRAFCRILKGYLEAELSSVTEILSLSTTLISPINNWGGGNKFLGVKAQTWGSYQHRGLAAVEAVQQRLAADVLVEERHRRAQLGQSQPGKHEGGLIPHEKSHGVPSFVPGLRPQRVGCFAADSVGVGVRVTFLLKNNKCFVRSCSSLLQEAI